MSQPAPERKWLAKPARRSKATETVSGDPHFDWLRKFGVSRVETSRLLPTLPGGLTSANSFFVNSNIPDKVFRGREQGSIPLTSGRWFLFPMEIVQAHPRLMEEPLSLASARSSLDKDDPRAIAAWTAGG